MGSRGEAPVIARRLLVVALCGALGCAASGGKDPAPWAVPEATVDRIEWSGVEALEPDELEEAMLTEAPGWQPWREAPPFDAATFENDLQRVEDLYRRRGYYDASVRGQIDPAPEPPKVVVRIEVEEGEPVLLRERHISWAPGAEPRPALLEGLPLDVGDVFGADAYADARSALLEALASEGFMLARLEGGAEVDPAAYSARLDWEIHPGPRARVGEVRLLGLEDVKPELIEPEITLEPGQLLTPEAMGETQRKLVAVGLFRSVVVEPVRLQAEDGAAEVEWPVQIRLEERPPRSIQVGVGFGTEDGPRGLLGWRHRNWLGGRRELSFEARGSALGFSGEARLVQPRVPDPLTTLELQARAEREDLPAYDADRLRVGISLARPLFEHWKVRGGYGFEYSQVDAAAGEELDPDDPDTQSVTLGFLLFGAQRSTLDDKLNPSRGSWLDMAVESALEPLGSEVDYLRLNGEVRHFFPLREEGDVVLALRLRAAAVDPIAGSARVDIPITRRLFSGGSTSVRGFPYQKLGPLDDDEDPLGGLSLVESSVELRFPIWRDLGGVVFSDAGQVALEPYSFRMNDVFYSAGAGLRYQTPVGPLRLDLAYGLNSPDELDRFHVHLSVGQAF